MSTLDDILKIKHKTLVGLEQITNISGDTLLASKLTVPSNLYVSGASIFQTSINAPIITGNNQTITSNLNVSGVGTIQNLIVNNISSHINASTFMSTLNVSGTAIFNNISNTSQINNGILVVSGVTSLQALGATSISASSIIIPNATITSILRINNNIVDGISSLNSTLNVSGSSLFNSTISVSGTATMNNITTNDIASNGNLVIAGTTTIIGQSTLQQLSATNITANNLTINSGLTTLQELCSGNLTVSGTSQFVNVLLNSATCTSNLTVLGQLIDILPNYDTNAAAKAGGVPVWGFYRTGGLVKVRLEDVSPTITLSGSSSINLMLGSSYTDPGVVVTDNYDSNVQAFIVSIGSESLNILSNSVLVTGTSTLVTQTSTLPAGIYTITYNAYDFSGNVGTNTRTLTVISSYQHFSGTTVPFTSTSYYTLTNKLLSSMSFNEDNFISSGFYFQSSAYVFSVSMSCYINRGGSWYGTDDSSLYNGPNDGAAFPLIQFKLTNNTFVKIMLIQRTDGRPMIKSWGNNSPFNWVPLETQLPNWWITNNTTYNILFIFSNSGITCNISKTLDIANGKVFNLTPGWNLPNYPGIFEYVNVGAFTDVTPAYPFAGTIQNIKFANKTITWNQAFNNELI